MSDRSINVLPLEIDALQGLYHYTESGLNNYWLSPSLYEEGEFNGQKTIAFLKLDEMQTAIGLHICSLGRRLGPLEIRFLRGELDYSQRELGEALGFADKQCIAKAERQNDKHEALSATADLLLRNLYLRHLGDGAHLIEDNYRQEALKLAQDLRKPYLAETHNWKLAA